MMPKPNVNVVEGAYEAKSFSIVSCEHGSVFIRLHDRAGKTFAFACFDRGTAVNALGQLESAITGQAGFVCESLH